MHKLSPVSKQISQSFSIGYPDYLLLLKVSQLPNTESCPKMACFLIQGPGVMWAEKEGNGAEKRDANAQTVVLTGGVFELNTARFGQRKESNIVTEAL